MAAKLGKKAKSTSYKEMDRGGGTRGARARPLKGRFAALERPKSWAGLPSSDAKPGTILSVGESSSAKADSIRMRRIIIEQSYRAGVGHVGSALSVVDILAVLYDNILKIFSPDDPTRDRFVLSKGHAALALYAALNLKGWLSDTELSTFCADGTSLGVHPEFLQRGVDFATGSLGQGLTFGVGAALAAKWQQSQRRVFVLLSDAECNEGSVWEAVMVAKQHGLGNLIAIVDVNGQQALDYTQNVIGLQPLENRWKGFGWDVHSIDGHDHVGLGKIMRQLDKHRTVPHVLLAQTVFGKGVSYMQSQIKWHYLPMSEEECGRALQELEGNS